jgi:hypothetical protein
MLAPCVGRLYGLGKDKTLYGRYPIYIEDAAAGSMMLARAPELHIDAMPVPSSWTSWGKDLRQGRAHMTAAAHGKTSMLKGVERNHLLAQLAGFRIGDKAAHKRADDLLDAFVMAVLIAFEEVKE